MLIYLLALQNVQAHSCAKKIKNLIQKKEKLTRNGGAWEVFEKKPQLKINSINGLKLDAKINQIIELSHYLCKTLKGVPLNELATYVLGELELQGEKNFREQLKIFGKPEAEINAWFHYSKIALSFQNRKLDNDSVKQTIENTQNFVEKYETLLKNLWTQTETHAVIPDPLRLIEKINKFLITDSNMALAVHEKSLEPYWDTDENYGGS